MYLLLNKSPDLKQGKEGEIKALFRLTDRLARSSAVYIIGVLTNTFFNYVCRLREDSGHTAMSTSTWNKDLSKSPSLPNVCL